MTTSCNVAPGAAVSPAGAVSDGPETGSALRGYRARRPARFGRQVHVQVNMGTSFCLSSDRVSLLVCDQANTRPLKTQKLSVMVI